MHRPTRVSDLARFASALLRATRHSLEYSTAEMARVLDIPKTTYLRLEGGRGVSRRSARVLFRAIEVLEIVPREVAMKKVAPALRLLANLTSRVRSADQLKKLTDVKNSLEEIERNRASRRNGSRALKSFQHEERLRMAWQDILFQVWKASPGSDDYQNISDMLAKARGIRPAAGIVRRRRSLHSRAMFREFYTPQVLIDFIIKNVLEHAAQIET